MGRGAAWQAGDMACRLPTFTNSVLTAALAGEGAMLLERRTIRDLEELLDERLALLHARRKSA